MVLTERLLLWTSSMLLLASYTTAVEQLNVTEHDNYVSVYKENGRVVFMEEELLRKLREEEETWHWTPWLRTRTVVADNIVRQAECPANDSIDNFPDSIFDDDQLRRGGFVLYLLMGIYAFTLLALVCNDYFIPCVELICEDLKIPQNVAAATFMAAATSTPELFVNLISTFLTESDMGIGTILGSAIFNALGVSAVGSLAAAQPILIEARPLTRDAVIYMLNVSVLIGIIWDGYVEWFEAMVLVILYVLYFVVMFNSTRMFTVLDKAYNKRKKPKIIIDNGKSEKGLDNGGFVDVDKNGQSFSKEKAAEIEDDIIKPEKSLWRWPKEKSIAGKILWLYLWPLKLVLTCTVPSPVTFRKLYPLSFIMCIVLIGCNSYFVSWSMTVIGHTFLIPESVMGMTFLAFGGCLPEACSIYIMSRRGEGGIGVSNALGANSLAILSALGIPWLIRTLTLIGGGADITVVRINSSGLDYVVISLLFAVVCLWVTLFVGKFKLRKSIGFVLLILYAAFITFAILSEMGFIFALEKGC